MTSLDPVLLIVAALAAACVLSARRSVRQCAGLAAATFALGYTSLAVALDLAGADPTNGTALAALPQLAVRVDAGFELLGICLAIAATALAWRAERRTGELAAAALSVGAAAAMLAISASHARAAGPLITLGVTVVLAVAGMLALSAADRLPLFPQAPLPTERPDAPLLGATALGAALAIAGPHLYVAIPGAMLAAVAGHLLARRMAARRRIPLLPVLAIPTLAFVGWYMHEIAAPTGLSIAALREGPFSPAAEAMLIVPLALGAVGFIGPWPLARFVPGPALAIVGVALLLRLGAGVLPGAVDAWRTVFVPIGVLALWGGAIVRRPELVAAALAWIACFVPGAGGAAGAWMVAGSALAGSVLATAQGPTRMSMPLAVAAAIAGACGAALALGALLHAEVVYGVATWAGIVVAVYIWRAE